VATVSPTQVVGLGYRSVEGAKYYQRNDWHQGLLDTAPAR
jgi:hypothetical protein